MSRVGTSVNREVLTEPSDDFGVTHKTLYRRLICWGYQPRLARDDNDAGSQVWQNAFDKSFDCGDWYEDGVAISQLLGFLQLLCRVVQHSPPNGHLDLIAAFFIDYFGVWSIPPFTSLLASSSSRVVFCPQPTSHAAIAMRCEQACFSSQILANRDPSFIISRPFGAPNKDWLRLRDWRGRKVWLRLRD